jgi:hypothetical protein
MLYLVVPIVYLIVQGILIDWTNQYVAELYSKIFELLMAMRVFAAVRPTPLTSHEYVMLPPAMARRPAHPQQRAQAGSQQQQQQSESSSSSIASSVSNASASASASTPPSAPASVTTPAAVPVQAVPHAANTPKIIALLPNQTDASAFSRSASLGSLSARRQQSTASETNAQDRDQAPPNYVRDEPQL